MLCAEAERDGTGTCDVRMSASLRNGNRKGSIKITTSLQGDSGGPLMVNNRGTWELVGVTSWGVDCEQKGLPTMYAAIRRECNEPITYSWNLLIWTHCFSCEELDQLKCWVSVQ